MGFINAIDNFITDTRTRNGARSEADAFAAKVKPGQTVYTVVRHRLPEGGEHDLIHEHIATGRSPVTGQPMFGHMSASALWLGHGPVYTERPRGLQTIRERTEANEKQAGPDIHGRISDY